MMRDQGGAIGITACGAILNDRTNFHFLVISCNLTPANATMVRLLTGVPQRFNADPGSLETRHVAALKQLWELAYRGASTMAYAGAFRGVMIAFMAVTILVPLVRKVAVPKAPAIASH